MRVDTIMKLNPEQIQALRREPYRATGNRIGAAIRIADIRAKDLSRAIGIPQQQISDLKGGRWRNVRIDTAYAFARFFGCAIEDLFPRAASRKVAA